MATRTVDLGSVIGPQGPRGYTGAAGAAGARGPRGRGCARLVVGTSKSGWTADDCDYLCDGTADQAEINAAIAALPSTGGEIVLLDGTYNTTAAIALQSWATVYSTHLLKCPFREATTYSRATIARIAAAASCAAITMS